MPENLVRMRCFAEQTVRSLAQQIDERRARVALVKFSSASKTRTKLSFSQTIGKSADEIADMIQEADLRPDKMENPTTSLVWEGLRKGRYLLQDVNEEVTPDLSEGSERRTVFVILTDGTNWYDGAAATALLEKELARSFYSTADYPHRLVYSVGDVAVDPLDVSKTAAAIRNELQVLASNESVDLTAPRVGGNEVCNTGGSEGAGVDIQNLFNFPGAPHSDQCCTTAAVDLVFIFDRSNSQETRDGCQKKLAGEIANILNSTISANGIRVAATSFSGEGVEGIHDEASGLVHFGFDAENTAESIAASIRKLDLTTTLSNTDTSQGFKVTREQLLTSSTPGFRGYNVPVVVVVLTDGHTHFQGRLQEELALSPWGNPLLTNAFLALFVDANKNETTAPITQYLADSDSVFTVLDRSTYCAGADEDAADVGLETDAVMDGSGADDDDKGAASSDAFTWQLPAVMAKAITDVSKQVYKPCPTTTTTTVSSTTTTVSTTTTTISTTTITQTTTTTTVSTTTTTISSTTTTETTTTTTVSTTTTTQTTTTTTVTTTTTTATTTTTTQTTTTATTTTTTTVTTTTVTTSTTTSVTTTTVTTTTITSSTTTTFPECGCDDCIRCTETVCKQISFKNPGFGAGGPARTTAFGTPRAWSSSYPDFPERFMGIGQLQSSDEIGSSGNSLFITKGGIQQQTSVQVGIPYRRNPIPSPRHGIEYVLKASVTLPKEYEDKGYELADFSLVIKNEKNHTLARADYDHVSWTAIAASLGYIAEVRWPATAGDVGTYVTIALEAGNPHDGYDAKEGSIAVFDHVTFCEASKECTPTYPTCNQQMLDATVLVDTSGSVVDRPDRLERHFGEAIGHIRELKKQLRAELKKEHPRYTHVRAELLVFSDADSEATTLWPTAGKQGGYLNDDTFKDFLATTQAAMKKGFPVNRETSMGHGILSAMRHIVRSRVDAENEPANVTRTLLVVSDGGDTETRNAFEQRMATYVKLLEGQPLTCLFHVAGTKKANVESGSPQPWALENIKRGRYSPAACLAPFGSSTVAAQVAGGAEVANLLVSKSTGPVLQYYHCRQDPFHCTCKGDYTQKEFDNKIDQCSAMQTLPEVTVRPTPATSVAPATTEGQVCADSPGWHDSGDPDFDCKWYSEMAEGRCAKYGTRFDNFGMSANAACCACNGGIVSGTPLLDGPETYTCERGKKILHFLSETGQRGGKCTCKASPNGLGDVCVNCVYGAADSYVCTLCKRNTFLFRGECVNAEGCIINGLLPQKGPKPNTARGGICVTL